jgi:hypothetical protein
LRKAAQRLVRLFPSNRFYKPIQDYLKKAAITNEQLSWMAEAAAFYFYNRIAEFQGSFALEDSGRKWIEGNYENGKAWVEKAAARDPDHRILGAMLDYARASVLWDWDRKEKDANEYYKRMLETIRSLDASYPLNPHHVAAALAVTNGYPVSRVPDTTRPYAPDDRRKLTGTAYETDKKKQITLFALPDDTSKKVADIASELKGRMILRTDNWDLVQVAKNLGWAERKPVTTAGRRQ